MGLLDNLLKGTGDPQKDAALSQGLLQAGLSLLSSRGNFGNALGQAGMQGLQGFQQSQDRSFQQSQRQMQMEQLKRQQQLQQQQDAWKQNAVSPQMQASQAALGGGGGPTMANAAKAQPVDPNRQMLFEAMQASVVDPKTYIESLQPKAADYKVVGETLLQVGPGGVKEAYRAPAKPEKDNPALAILKEAYGADSPEYRSAVRRLAGKTETHAPPQSVISLGAPVPVQLPDGSIGYAQPGNRPGAAPQMMVGPGGKPMIKPADKSKDLTESQAKATAFLGQMKAASGELSAIGADQSALSMQAETALAGGPVNIAIGQKAQRVRQAQDQWSEAFLRFKTGAASTPAEVKSNRETFFPKMGDRDDVIAQKKRMRAQAESDMAIAAGRGAEKLDQPAQPTANDPLGLR